jgi:hypothetical protein
MARTGVNVSASRSISSSVSPTVMSAKTPPLAAMISALRRSVRLTAMSDR